MRPSSTIALAFAILCSAGDTSAQSVPLLSFDAAIGRGPHSEAAGNVWFRSAVNLTPRIALALRLGSAGRVRPVLIVERTVDAGANGYTADCALAPDGSCRAWFPRTFGNAAALGIRAALPLNFLAGLFAGVGNYSSRVRFAGADLSAELIPHVSIVAELRHVVWHDAAGHPLWMRPFTAGLRVSL
jgi:hypothetical protein